MEHQEYPFLLQVFSHWMAWYQPIIEKCELIFNVMKQGLMQNADNPLNALGTEFCLACGLLKWLII